MSLLLDARKKAALALQQSGPQASMDPQGSGRDARDADQKTTHQIEENMARIAGQTLFAAKSARDYGGLGILPVAIIIGLVLAGSGGYYIWHEISPAPLALRPSPSAPQPVQITQPAPAAAIENKVAYADAGQKRGLRTEVRGLSKKPRPPSSPQSSVLSPQPTLVKHNQETDTLNQTLVAAYQAYRAGDFATAWQRYRTVLQQDAKNRDALLGMAAIAQQQGQDATAVQYYGQVLTLDPRDPAAHAGLSALTTGDAASTESRLKLLLAQRPDAAPLYFALGNLYAEQSRWGEAQQAYLNAANREPDDAQYAFNLAVSFDHLGQRKLAAQYYARTLQLDRSGIPGFNREQVQQRANELTAP